jgi:hypothetical protein
MVVGTDLICCMLEVLNLPLGVQANCNCGNVVSRECSSSEAFVCDVPFPKSHFPFYFNVSIRMDCQC